MVLILLHWKPSREPRWLFFCVIVLPFAPNDPRHSNDMRLERLHGSTNFNNQDKFVCSSSLFFLLKRGVELHIQMNLFYHSQPQTKEIRETMKISKLILVCVTAFAAKNVT